MNKLAVVALGGNALIRGNETGNIEQQEQNAKNTLENLIYLIKDGYDLVITHGNGPQVGNILMRHDAGRQIYGIPEMPLNVCVAYSQGEIGYIIERMLRNILNEHGIKKNIITMTSMVEVDSNDIAFKKPTKRVGRIYSKEQALEMQKEKGWFFTEIKKKKGGWRRVVASPFPKRVLNRDVIESMARKGNIVIAVGGGGIPVYFDAQGNIRTVDAVIDKDLASAILASNINANELYILTDVPFIYKDYGLPTQEKLEFLDYKDTTKYLKNGTFEVGTMEPKIRAALRFIENGGEKSVITEATKLENRSYGSKITMKYD